MNIAQIMSSPVQRIEPSATVAAAAKKMRDEDVGCLLVGKSNQLFGIVTDRDIAIRALADGRNAIGDPLWTVMSGEVVCCFEDQPVEEAARIMREHGLRRLPVLDEHGFVSGIVSSSDIFAGGSTKKPWQITFFKQLTDSRGTVHETPLTRIYVAGVGGEDEAAAAAARILKKDWCLSGRQQRVDGWRAKGGAASGRRPALRGPLDAGAKAAAPSSGGCIRRSQTAGAADNAM